MEAYSPHMAAAVRQQLRQASAQELARLLAYFQHRRGPGLALVEAEAAQRIDLYHHNYFPQLCPPSLQTPSPTPTPIALAAASR